MRSHRYLSVRHRPLKQGQAGWTPPGESERMGRKQDWLSREKRSVPPSKHDARKDRLANQSLGALESNAIAIIGYQLWTPLSAIKACLELLASPEGIDRDDDRRSMVELALQETVGLEELVRECLALFVAVESTSRVDEVSYGTACPLLPTLELLQEALTDAASRCGGQTVDVVFGGPANSAAIAMRHEGALGTGATLCGPPEYGATMTDREEYRQMLRHKLSAIVGHELRTPLCSLKVCFESLLGDPQQFRCGDLRTLMELAQADLERLRQLVEQFFTLSRLERGLILHTRAVVDLEKTLDLVVSGLQIQHRDLPRVGLDIPQTLPLVRVDEDKLLLALGQLLDNALQFTGEDGTVTIEVRPFQLPKAKPEHHFLEIVVADTGRGIDPARLEQVFDCFYQEEDFLRRTVGGTGIGLSICRKLIEAMGGRIWARSSGRALGSRIHLTLPTVGYCAV